MDLLIRASGQSYQETGLSFNAEPFQLGLLGTVGALCYSICCLFSGSISDRVGRRVSVYASLIGISLALFCASRANRIGVLLLIPILGGSSMAFFWPAAQAWLADLAGRSPRRLARRMCIFNCSWSAGLMVGPIYTGVLWAHWQETGLPSQRLVFTSLIGFAVLLGVLLTLVRNKAREDTAEDLADARNGSTNPYTASLLFAGRVGTFAAWFAAGAVGSLFPKLGEFLEYDERLRGLLVGSYHAGQSGAFFLAIFTTRWAYRRWPVAVAEAIAIVGMISLLWADTPIHFALVFVATGVCSGLVYSVSLFHSLHGRTSDRGKLAGVHEAILACGVFMGPLLGGLLAQHVNLRAPYVLVASIMAATLAVQAVVWHRGKASVRESAGP